MESPVEAPTGIEHDPNNTRETVAVKFRPCISKLDDGSTDEIKRNFVVQIKIEVGEEDMTVQDFIRELGEQVVWGSGQEVELCSYVEKGKYERITTVRQLVHAIEQGRTADAENPEITIYAELIDAREDPPVGYVPSKAAELINDEAFLERSEPVLNVADLGQKQIPTPTDLNGQGEGSFVDWSQVNIDEPTDFAPEIFNDVEMYKLYGSRVDDEEEQAVPAPPPPLPARGASDQDDVGDEDEEEMGCVYDKEHPVFKVSTLWPSMQELKMALRTFAVNTEFAARTAWTDKNRFYAKCKGLDGNMQPCRWYMSVRRQPDGRLIRVNQIPHKHTCVTSARKVTKMTSQAWIAEKVMGMLSKRPNTTAKRLQHELEKDYKCKISYNTVWKGKQRAVVIGAIHSEFCTTSKLKWN